MLWELVAHRSADFFTSLVKQIIGRSKAADIRYCLNVPDDNVWHWMCLLWNIETGA